MHCNKADLVACLTSTIKGDVGNLTHVATLLKVDSQILTLIMSCAMMRFDMLNDSYKFIGDSFDIEDTAFIKFIIAVASGDTSAVEDIRPFVNATVDKVHRKLIKSLFILNVEASKMREQYIPDLDKSVVSNYKIIESLTAHKLDISSDNIEDNDPFHISKIMKACWGDEEAIKSIASSFKKFACSISSPLKNKDLQNICGHFPDKMDEMIRRMLKKVFEEARQSVSTSYSRINEAAPLYSENLHKLQAKLDQNRSFRQITHSGEKFSFIFQDESIDSINEPLKLDKETMQIVKKLGCTISTGQLRQLEGIYFRQYGDEDELSIVCIF